MKMKRLITIALILMISMLLIACSKKIEPQGNASTSEETQKNETIPPVIAEPEEENDTIIPVENVTEPIKNQTEENITEPEENKTEEEPLSQEDAHCKSILNKSCTGAPGLGCIGEAELDLEEDTITFSVRNDFGSEINLVRLKSLAEDESLKCTTRYTIESVSIRADSPDFVDISASPAIAYDQVFDVRIKLSEINKGYVNQGFDLVYLGNDKENTGSFRITAIGN